MPDDQRRMMLFIKDIMDALERIEEYTAPETLESLKKNRMAIDAIIRNFEIIGEAVAHIPDEIKGKHSHIAWREARSFRNILTHHYFGVNVETVWDTVKNNIPEFRKHIRQLYEQEKE